MPLHLDSIAPDIGPAAENFLRPDLMDSIDDVIYSEDERILHIAHFILDSARFGRVGKLIYTLLRDPDPAESYGIIDIDLTLCTKQTPKLRFLRKLPQSSDANEYYDVENAQGQRLQVETVNRSKIAGELTGTERYVHACAFPFRFDVFDDIDALNRAFGWNAEDGEVGGLSETFAAPASLTGVPDEDADESDVFSILAGTVRAVRDASMSIVRCRFDFTIAEVETALGVIPVALSERAFDLSELAPGKAVFMYAYVKADLALFQDLPKPEL